MVKSTKRMFASGRLIGVKKLLLNKKDTPLSVKPDLVKTVIGFTLTGLLGAAATYGITVLNRLPSRALTILPAGVHMMEGPILRCDDSEFITGTVNTYIDTEVTPPSCNMLLTKTQTSNLIRALRTASKAYETERLNTFTSAKRRIDALAASPPASESQFKTAILASIGDLEYIHQKAPRNLPAKALFLWTQNRINDVLASVTAQYEHIGKISESLKASDKPPAKQTDLFFVATNASDVEFYVSTVCELKDSDQSVPIVLEKVDRDDVLSSSLVFLPILPGRGRLMKYMTSDQIQLNKMVLSDSKLSLSCKLANGRRFEGRPFLPAPFVVREQTFSPD